MLDKYGYTHARARTHTHNMQYLLLSHGNNGYANEPQCYVIRSLPVLYNLPRVSVPLWCTKQHDINTYSGIKISLKEFFTYMH
jgi:hypothetical protein